MFGISSQKIKRFFQAKTQAKKFLLNCHPDFDGIFQLVRPLPQRGRAGIPAGTVARLAAATPPDSRPICVRFHAEPFGVRNPEHRSLEGSVGIRLLLLHSGKFISRVDRKSQVR